jgi:hypothetical protein
MAKYNRDSPLPSSDPMFKKKTVGVMTAREAQARKDAYESQTGKKYVPKGANEPVLGS